MNYCTIAGRRIEESVSQNVHYAHILCDLVSAIIYVDGPAHRP